MREKGEAGKEEWGGEEREEREMVEDGRGTSSARSLPISSLRKPLWIFQTKLQQRKDQTFINLWRKRSFTSLDSAQPSICNRVHGGVKSDTLTFLSQGELQGDMAWCDSGIQPESAEPCSSTSVITSCPEHISAEVFFSARVWTQKTHCANILPKRYIPNPFTQRQGQAKLPKQALNLLWNPGKLWNYDLPALASQVSKSTGSCPQALLLLMLLMPFLS